MNAPTTGDDVRILDEEVLERLGTSIAHGRVITATGITALVQTVGGEFRVPIKKLEKLPDIGLPKNKPPTGERVERERMAAVARAGLVPPPEELFQVSTPHSFAADANPPAIMPDVNVVPPTAYREAVNHPAHYNQHPSGVECITIVEHMTFNVGSAVKYAWRAGLKAAPGEDSAAKRIEDLKKAVWYLTREIELLQRRS